MKWDFLVLGGFGAQGRIVVKDLLSRGYKVYIGDLYPNVGKKYFKKSQNLKYERVDVEELHKTKKLIKKTSPDVVISCVEDDYNLTIYKACLVARANVVDLGSDTPNTRKQFRLNKSFRRKRLVAVTGCGSAPGINNIMLDFVSRFFDRIETIESGFAWDSNIKKFVVPFSISSIAFEFENKADVLENGKWIKVDPLTTRIKKTIRMIGVQDCHILRHPEPYMFFRRFRNKGVKNIFFYGGFPAHSLRVIEVIVGLGLANDKIVRVYWNRKEIYPSEVATEILKRIKYPRGYKEKENIWVKVIGYKDNKRKVALMECIVPTIKGWENAGCNIDTGIPASIIARMVKEKVINRFGVFDPGEIVSGMEFFRELKKYKMKIYLNSKKVV